jgi:outer membrane protein assembly factor BamA
MIAALAMAALCAVATAGAPPRQAAAPTETIAEIRIHGNHVSTDAEILAIAGVTIGAPFEATTLADVTARLRATRRFRTIEVLKRFASIDDATRIALVIVVNEGPVRIELPDAPGAEPRIVRRRGLRNLMFMPILDGEDGYGLTYGVRLAYLPPADRRSRLSFPLTWGGLKRAGAEWERPMTGPVLSRVQAGAAIDRQTNPAYDEPLDRRRLWARAERAWGPVRVGGTAGWQRVTFDETGDTIRSVAADVVLDTRLDPILPRNAVYALASRERLAFESGGHLYRTRFDARGFVGLIDQTVLVVRAARESTDRPAPRYLRSLLGGWSSLRGFHAGAFTGDTAVMTSLELRIPLSSPLSVGKLGVSVFADAGKAYDAGQAFGTAEWRSGAGAAVWIAGPAFRMSLAVAHGRGASTRVNFGVGLAF